MVTITRLDDCIDRMLISSEIKKIEENMMGEDQSRIDKAIKAKVKEYKKSDKYKEMSKKDKKNKRKEYKPCCEKKFVDEQIKKRHFLLIGDTPNNNRKILYGYEKGIYMPQGDSFIASDYENLYSNAFTNSNPKDYDSVIKTIKAKVFDANKLDLNITKDVICLENGCFNLKNKEYEPHNPDYILVNKYPIVYDKQAKISDAALKFFNDLCNNDLKKLGIMQRFMGSMFLGNSKHKVFIMGYGETNSGKSTFALFLETIFNDKNVSHVRFHQFNDDKFIFNDFFRKILNIAPELERSELKARAIANIKALVGGDTIRADKKYETPFNFKNEATLLMLCNKTPTIISKDKAFWQRMLLFEFKATFDLNKSQEETISEITTKKEISGIFNWCIEGLIKLEDESGFNLDGEEVETEYFAISSENESIEVFNFIDERIVYSSGKLLIKEEVYIEYVKYCQKEDINIISLEDFDKIFRTMCIRNDIDTLAGQITKGGKHKKAWTNIAFKTIESLF